MGLMGNVVSDILRPMYVPCRQRDASGRPTPAAEIDSAEEIMMGLKRWPCGRRCVPWVDVVS